MGADDSGCYKYNPNSNKLELMTKYTSFTHHHMSIDTQFMDIMNDTLYLFSSDAEYLGFNIKTKRTCEGRNGPVEQIGVSGDFPKAFYVEESLIKEMHVLGKWRHCKFDYVTREFTEICYNNYVDYPKLLYNPLFKQLMILGGDGLDGIWTFDVIKENNARQEWKLHDTLKMPHCVGWETDYDVLIIGDILFVFYFDAHNDEDIDVKYNDIWCLNLLDNKWYKSKYDAPSGLKRKSYSMKLKASNIIHLLNFEYQLHFKIDLHDLLSMEFIKARRDYYNPLVIGYVKQKEKDCKTNIPFVLRQLILEYFPVIDCKKC